MTTNKTVLPPTLIIPARYIFMPHPSGLLACAQQQINLWETFCACAKTLFNCADSFSSCAESFSSCAESFCATRKSFCASANSFCASAKTICACANSFRAVAKTFCASAKSPSACAERRFKANACLRSLPQASRKALSTRLSSSLLSIFY